jgi:hypothetical protein
LRIDLRVFLPRLVERGRPEVLRNRRRGLLRECGDGDEGKAAASSAKVFRIECELPYWRGRFCRTICRSYSRSSVEPQPAPAIEKATRMVGPQFKSVLPALRHSVGSHDLAA